MGSISKESSLLIFIDSVMRLLMAVSNSSSVKYFLPRYLSSTPRASPMFHTEKTVLVLPASDSLEFVDDVRAFFVYVPL
jgi:hypothetical protein